MAFIENHIYHITPIAPIHLGCDKDYFPYSFIIDNNTLFYCEPSNFSSSLPQNKFQEFAQKALPHNNNSMSELQRFAYKNKTFVKLNSNKKILVTDAINHEYTKKQQKLSESFNQFNIERTAYNPANDSYLITGTSIKGAIRTALLNLMARKNSSALPRINKNSADGKKDGETQKKLLGGDFSTDPLRLIKIGDASSNNDTIGVIGQTVMVKRNQVDGKTIDKNSPSQFVEVLVPGQMNAFEGKISINNFDIKHKEMPKFSFSLQEIIHACNEFYLPIFEEEFAKLAMLRILDRTWDESMTNMQNSELFADIRANKVMLIRIGKHSGAESITIKNARSIKIMGKNGGQTEYRDAPTTYWLYTESRKPNNTMPFGWALISFDNEYLPSSNIFSSLFEKFNQKLQAGLQHAKSDINELKIEIERQRTEEEEKSKKQALEEAQAKVKQAAFESMSDEQKTIQTIKDGLSNEAFKNAGAGTDYDQLIKAAIDTACKQNWPHELKTELKEVAIQGASYLGIDAKKNKKYKELLRLLN